MFWCAPTQTASTGLAERPIFLTVLADHCGYGSGDVVSRSDRGLDVHDQDGIIARVGQQQLERRCVALGVGVADDVDGI